MLIDRLTVGQLDYKPEEIVQSAINQAARHQKALAQQHNINLSENDVNKYIEDMKQTIAWDTTGEKLVTGVSRNLGLTMDELFFEYDRDHYLENLIWIKLKPYYEESNPNMENETALDYNKRLVQYYNQDITKMMN